MTDIYEFISFVNALLALFFSILFAVGARERHKILGILKIVIKILEKNGDYPSNGETEKKGGESV